MEYAPIASGTLTIDQNRDTVFLVNLNANVTSITFPSNTGKAGQRVEVHLVQDSTGGRTVTWPSSVKFAAGTAPTLTTTPSKRDVIVLRQVSNPSDSGGVKYAEVGRTLNVAA